MLEVLIVLVVCFISVMIFPAFVYYETESYKGKFGIIPAICLTIKANREMKMRKSLMDAGRR